MLSVGIQTQWGRGGNVKEGLELTPMTSFNVEQGVINSGPDSRRVPEWVRTDGPSFSLCAAPLESSGTGFQSEGQRSGEQAEVWRCTSQRWQKRLVARGGVRIGNINAT